MELQVDGYVNVFWQEITTCYCNSRWGVRSGEESSIDLVIC